MKGAGGIGRCTLILQPGDGVDYATADWADTLVIVERGELELECASGRCARFAVGAVLTLVGLPVRRLRNPGPGPLVLAAITRRPPRR